MEKKLFDNTIREFSLAQSSWVMSHYNMLHKYGKFTRAFSGEISFLILV